MSIYNAIAQGTNPGAGMVKGAQIKRENRLSMEKEQRAYMMAGLEKAMSLPPEHRAGFLSMYRDQVQATGIPMPELPDDMPQLLESLPGAVEKPIVLGPGAQMRSTDGALMAQAPFKPDSPKTPVAIQGENGPVYVQPGDAVGRQPYQSPKAKADAQLAEIKLRDEQNLQAEKEQTKIQLQSIAQEILADEDAIDAVYGSISGLLPSMAPSTIDAEAKIDQLIDMLTLENTKKMTGVLSESDIKILQRAGTILANKRISENIAKKELRKIAGIVDKLNSAEGAAGAEIDALVNQYAD